jgi:hypothetical protein
MQSNVWLGQLLQLLWLKLTIQLQDTRSARRHYLSAVVEHAQVN